MDFNKNDRIDWLWKSHITRLPISYTPGTVSGFTRGGKIIVKWDDGKSTVCYKEFLEDNCRPHSTWLFPKPKFSRHKKKRFTNNVQSVFSHHRRGR